MSDVRSAVSFFLFPAVYFLFKRIKKMAVEKKERMLEHRKSDIPFISELFPHDYFSFY